MRYLVTFANRDIAPFKTNVFSFKKEDMIKMRMLIFDLTDHKYTYDGIVWEQIEGSSL